MKLYVDIVKNNICNYDGRCQFCNDKFDYGDCLDGEHFGTPDCPLKSRYAEIEIKDERLDNYPYELIVED